MRPVPQVAPQLGRLIGVGAFGKVHEAVWQGRRVAVKLLLCDSPLHQQVSWTVDPVTLSWLYVGGCT